MNLGWKSRAGLVLSAVWLGLVFLVADENHRTGQVLGLGLLPLVVIWGIVWAVQGWLAQRPQKPPTPPALQLEAKARRSIRIRTAVAVVVILGLGLFAATWQFEAIEIEGGGNPVAMWFGEWLVWGLLTYIVLRAVPKLPVAAPAVLTALVIVGAVNYKAYSRIAEDRQALNSVAKAAPLINKIQRGISVSDQEVRVAQVGMMEPLILAQAGYVREVIDIVATYEKTINGIQPELMLTPSSLASSSIRFQTRAKLKLWQQAAADYKTQVAAATARGKLAFNAALSQMPEAMSGSSKGFDESAAKLSSHMSLLFQTQREATQAIVGILDLMDANPTDYVVDKGPPANLLFVNESTLVRYRELVGVVMAASQREQEARTRLVQAESDGATKLGNLLRR